MNESDCVTPNCDRPAPNGRCGVCTDAAVSLLQALKRAGLDDLPFGTVIDIAIERTLATQGHGQ